jgi:hypothetical protein
MASARPESASCYTAYLAIRRCAGIEARVFTRVFVKPQANRVLGGDDSLCYTTVNAVGFSGTSRTDSRDLFHLHEPTSDAIPCHMTGPNLPFTFCITGARIPRKHLNVTRWMLDVSAPDSATHQSASSRCAELDLMSKEAVLTGLLIARAKDERRLPN